MPKKQSKLYAKDYSTAVNSYYLQSSKKISAIKGLLVNTLTGVEVSCPKTMNSDRQFFICWFTNEDEAKQGFANLKKVIPISANCRMSNVLRNQEGGGYNINIEIIGNNLQYLDLLCSQLNSLKKTAVKSIVNVSSTAQIAASVTQVTETSTHAVSSVQKIPEKWDEEESDNLTQTIPAPTTPSAAVSIFALRQKFQAPAEDDSKKSYQPQNLCLSQRS